ncbi:DUF2878 domain-containing protein [Marinobacter sp. SS5-14b]|uniref:DUF2878 domain-containing protein n=1 Tax=Marinobacter sp. SS5-14b TaxID=3050456 RepID=UPI0026DFB1B8|nr:DUF2878 domain-containing protein [Marinobacter sp. SS5-14b]
MIASEGGRNLLNFLLFQVGWFVCVLFPGLPAVALAGLFLLIHLLLVSQARFAELQFIGVGVVLGGLLDTLWFRAGVLGLAGTESVLAAPLWLIAIWAIFMTTLCHSLSWVAQRPWLPFVLAPFAGSLAYWSASKLGVVTLPDLTFSLAAIALGWLVLFPLLLFIRKHVYTELAS